MLAIVLHSPTVPIGALEARFEGLLHLPSVLLRRFQPSSCRRVCRLDCRELRPQRMQLSLRLPSPRRRLSAPGLGGQLRMGRVWSAALEQRILQLADLLRDPLQLRLFLRSSLLRRTLKHRRLLLRCCLLHRCSLHRRRLLGRRPLLQRLQLRFLLRRSLLRRPRQRRCLLLRCSLQRRRLLHGRLLLRGRPRGVLLLHLCSLQGRSLLSRRPVAGSRQRRCLLAGSVHLGPMCVGGLGRRRSGRGNRGERLLLLRRHRLVVGPVRLDGVVQLRGAPLERLDGCAVRAL